MVERGQRLRALALALAAVGGFQCPATLQELSAKFWEWRARTQPFSTDDIPRLERPQGVRRSWSAASVAQMRTELAALRSCQRKRADGSVDARLLGSALSRVRWELDLNRRWRRDPTFYAEQALTPVLEALVKTPAVDEPELLSRLRNIPSLLDEARANLIDAVPAFAQLALASLQNIRGKLELLPVKDDSVAKAAEALEAFRDWLRERLPSMKGRASLGRAAYVDFLQGVALLPFAPEDLLALAKPEWERCVAAEALEQRRNQGAPALRLFVNIQEQIDAYVRDEGEVRAFLEERGVLTVPPSMGHYLVRPIPAYLDALGDFGEQDDFLGHDGVRFISPPSDQLGYFGRANARDPRPNLTHEGVPGHFFQLSLSRAHPDEVRRHYYDSGPNEGIGFYGGLPGAARADGCAHCACRGGLVRHQPGPGDLVPDRQAADPAAFGRGAAGAGREVLPAPLPRRALAERQRPALALARRADPPLRPEARGLLF